MLGARGSSLLFCGALAGCAGAIRGAQVPVATRTAHVTADCVAQPVDEVVALRRTADHLGIEVSEADIERAVEAVILSTGLGEETFWEWAPLTPLTYRERLREHHLVIRVFAASGGVLRPTEEELDRAYVDRFGDDPSESQMTRRFLRERLRAELRAELEAGLLSAFRTQLVAWWRSREMEIVDGRCVEALARVDPWELLIRGNEALSDDEVREAIAAPHPSVIVGPLDQVVSPVTDRLIALYYERGHLEVEARRLNRVGSRWQLTVVEGPVYRLRRVSIVEERDGAEIELIDAERLVAIQPGPFVRSRVMEAIEATRRWLELQGGGAVEITPNADLDRSARAVDITLVVRRRE